MSSLVILTAAPRSRALVGAAFVVACLGASAHAQTLPSAAMPSAAMPSTAMPSAAPAPAAKATMLPTIRVTARHAKRGPSPARSTATAATTPPIPSPSYNTAAPTLAGRAPLHPHIARQTHIHHEVI